MIEYKQVVNFVGLIAWVSIALGCMAYAIPWNSEQRPDTWLLVIGLGIILIPLLVYGLWDLAGSYRNK